MYKYLKDGIEVVIESEAALEEMLLAGIITGEEKVTNTENGMEGLLKQSKWYRAASIRNPKIIKESSGSKTTGIICFVIGLLATFLYAALKIMIRIGSNTSGSSADAGQISVLFGSLQGILLGSLIFPAIIGLIRKLRTKRTPSIRFLGITYLICSLISLMGGFNSTINRNTQSNAFTESLDIIVEGRTSLKDWEPIVYEKQIYGEYTELGNLFQEYSVECKNMNQQLIGSLQNTDYTQVISPSTLENEEKVRTSINKVKEIVENIEVYEKNLDSLNKEYDAKLENLTISDSIKNNFIENNWLEAKEYEVSISQTFVKLKKPMENVLNLLEFMESKQGEYIVEDNNILFYTDKDVERYNELYGAMSGGLGDLLK